ncbi:hypothetical protein RIF29_41038 [Crotalaria pallida]|uniref:Uncharacterized protein n=1 Tax=Crotalaria pallida TaxID=3830 RepID=A0AAN9E482_CROPI
MHQQPSHPSRVQRLESTEKELRNDGLTMFKALESLTSIKDTLTRILAGLAELGEKNNDETFVKERVSVEYSESRVFFLEELRLVSGLANEVESKVDKYKREWEIGLISLTEENKDINNLLRIALLEKGTLEKRNNNNNNNNKRMPLLQFAELGWQRVGFGFMKGSGTTAGTNEQPTEANKSDTSGSCSCDDEEEIVVSLASTVESIMKNLRLEITQLRRSLEESRLDTERLRCLTEKQAKEIVENKLCIKELEDRERILAHKVEEYFMEIEEAKEEVTRWKEACELEVEAGKNEIEEHNKLVAALKQELHKTKGALEISNGKLKLKEELAMTAIAAQEATEKSLQLADSRAIQLCQQIEELTKQLEEAEKKLEHKNHNKVRHICWPWLVFKLSSGNNIANTRIGDVRRVQPEMQSLLH